MRKGFNMFTINKKMLILMFCSFERRKKKKKKKNQINKTIMIIIMSMLIVTIVGERKTKKKVATYICKVLKLICNQQEHKLYMLMRYLINEHHLMVALRSVNQVNHG